MQVILKVILKMILKIMLILMLIDFDFENSQLNHQIGSDLIFIFKITKSSDFSHLWLRL